MAPYSGIPSHRQQVTLALAPKFTAALSILGSMYIIVDVVSKRYKNCWHKKATSQQQQQQRQQQQNSNINSNNNSTTGTYHRLLIGLSVTDLIMSLGLFTSTWPMPVDTPHVYGAVGNTQTCTLVGFLETCGVGTVIYNASLSFYYLVRIRHGWSTRRIVQTHVELYMHIVPIGFALVTMFAGLFLDLYNSGLFDCWIAPLPQGCTESWRFDGATAGENMNPCIRGDNASLYQWVFDLIPKWSCILIVTINMILVHQAVLVQERRTLRRTFRAQAYNNTAVVTAASTSFAGTTTNTNHDASTRTTTDTPVGGAAAAAAAVPIVASAATTATAAAANIPNSNIIADPAPAAPATTDTAPTNAATIGSRRRASFAVAATATASTTRLSIIRNLHHAPQLSPITARLSRRLARQSYLYVGALYITYVPVIITRAFELTHGYVHYEMLLTISITIPLQGFWNGTFSFFCVFFFWSCVLLNRLWRCCS
jgi:hypothetical protein